MLAIPLAILIKMFVLLKQLWKPWPRESETVATKVCISEEGGAAPCDPRLDYFICVATVMS
jgi:hypothetical protein